MEPGAPDRPPPRWSLPALLAAAAALRLLHWAAVGRLPFVDRLVLDSAEYDRWARALAGGDWLGSEPFFQAPLYPYLVALLYRFAATPHAVYLLQIAAAVAGIWCIYRAGVRLVDARTGLAAAALAAFYAPFVLHDVQLLKESLAVGLVAALLWAVAEARARGTGRPWLLAGLTGGLLVLLRENALVALPCLLPLAWRRREASASLRRSALFLAGIALPLLPVAARNAAVGGGLLPTTYQGGVNFYIGNNPEADGTYRPLSPGRQIPAHERREPWRLAEAEAGRPLAAAEVSAHWRRRALAWARAEPGAFLRLQLRKVRLYLSPYEWPDAVDLYWLRARSPALAALGLDFAGLALLALAGAGAAWRRRLFRPLAPAWLFALAWMASTVAFFLFSRYRLPGLVPLFLFAGLPLAAALAPGASRRARLLALALLVAAWGLPRLALPAPRLDLVEQNLGRLAAERGETAEAEAHFRAALAAAPESFLPLVELGALAGRAGRPAEARAWLEKAVEREPGSVEAWANLGAARLALGDLPAAAAALDRALALDPGHLPALRNRELLARRAGTAGRDHAPPGDQPDEPGNPSGPR